MKVNSTLPTQKPQKLYWQTDLYCYYTAQSQCPLPDIYLSSLEMGSDPGLQFSM